jgi:hypothetical protein
LSFDFQVAKRCGGAFSRSPKGIEDAMGFILRSVFWLALASIIVPAEARLGYDNKAVPGREASLSEQMHDAAYAAWGFAVQVGKTCDTNPSFCAAGQDLISTMSDTGASLLQEAQTRLLQPQNTHLADAATQTQQHKKFQDRIE